MRPAPASLSLVAALLALGAMAAPVSYLLQRRNTRQQAQVTAEQITGGDVRAGRAAAVRYTCGACHQIPGVAGADGDVGPSLKGMALRRTIADRLPNTPEAMSLWLQHPQRVQPGGGMPEQGVTVRDAADLAAYLYTLR